MLDRLEEGRDRQRRLVWSASHELRSPIAAIRQHVEVALAHPEESDGQVAEVVLAEDLLQRMVEDLLLLTRSTRALSPSGARRSTWTTSCSPKRPACAPPTPGTGRHEGRLGMQGPRRRGTPRAARAQPHRQRDPACEESDHGVALPGRRRRGARSTTTAPASRCATGNVSSSGSRGWTRRAIATRGHRARLGDRPRDRQRASRHGHGIGRSDRGRSVRGDDPA